MKKFIATGIAACALAVVPGVALAAPALADSHGFDPQQIHSVLQNLGQEALQGGGQQATTQVTGGQAQTQTTDTQTQATEQQAPAQDATTQPAAAMQSPTKQRTFDVGISALGIGDNSELVELRGPADKIFQGGHPQVGQKEIGVENFIANPGGLPGIVHAKWNLMDPQGQVNDSISMDLVVIQKGPNDPPQLDLRNVKIEKNTVETRGVQFDSLGNVVIDFFRNA
jgi:hypothetical protein